jgi:hypothetical protein
LKQLYGTHDGYVADFARNASRLVAERWLLPANAFQDIVAAAQSNVLRSP